MAHQKVINIKCTACGSNDIQKTYRDEDGEQVPVAKCASCGTEYDRHSKEFYHYFADLFADDLDQTTFKLGTKGSLGGKNFEIIGRLRYQDEEDYEPDPWDEWVLISDEGWFGYLAEADDDDDEGFYLYQEYIPDSVDLYSSNDTIELNGKRFSKEEKGFDGRIVDFDGELPWRPEIGEGMRLYDVSIGKYEFTIEQTENEVSISRGEFFGYDEVASAFGVDVEDFDYYEDKKEYRSHSRAKKLVYGIGFALSFLFFVGVNFADKSLSRIDKNSIVLQKNKIVREKTGSSYYQSAILHGPVLLKKKEQLYGFELDVNESIKKMDNEWVSSKVYLIKEEKLKKAFSNAITQQNAPALKVFLDDIDGLKKVVEGYSFSEDFWHETGRDSDGPWEESDSNASEYAVMDEPGNYYFYQLVFSKRPHSTKWVDIKTSEANSSWYYLGALILFGLLFYYDRK